MTESAWKSAARHWWERMRQAERARDRWVEAAHRVGAENRLAFEERDELLQKLEELRAELREKGGQVFRLAQRLDERELAHLRSPNWRDSFDEKCAPLRAMSDKEWGDMSEQPSGISGELADLAERIAKADGKHPGDCEDTESHGHAAAKLGCARWRLKAAPTWENAILCELAEALHALACGDKDAFADELLDVATVAMRWRRAALERGKR